MDAGTTVMWINTYGSDAEANPLFRFLFHSFGAKRTLIVAIPTQIFVAALVGIIKGRGNKEVNILARWSIFGLGLVHFLAFVNNFLVMGMAY